VKRGRKHATPADTGDSGLLVLILAFWGASSQQHQHVKTDCRARTHRTSAATAIFSLWSEPVSPSTTSRANEPEKQRWDTLRGQNASSQQYLCEKSWAHRNTKPSSSCLRTLQNDISTPVLKHVPAFVLILRRKNSGWWICHFWVHANLRSDACSGVFGRKWVQTEIFDSSVGPVARL
jgi:hypothetical protein